MRSIFVILFLLCEVGYCWELEDSLVKITSIEASQNSRLFGTGILFQRGDAYFVLTTEHVLIPRHPYLSINYRAQGKGFEQEMELLSLDWGSGLALLRLKNPPNTSLQVLKMNDLLSFAHVSANRATKVLSAGFPVLSQSLVVEDGGELTRTDRPMDLFVHQKTLVEVSGASTELGMSGGLLISENLHPLGVLTHRAHASGKTYAIPIKDAVNWLRNQFTSNFKVQLSRISEKDAGGNWNTTIITGNYAVSLGREGISITHSKNQRLTEIPFVHSIFDVAKVEDEDRAPFGPRFEVDMRDGRASVVVEADILDDRTLAHQLQFTSYSMLGFRRSGIRNLLSEIVMPKSEVEFFLMLQDPNWTPLVQFKDPIWDWENFDRDRRIFPQFARALMEAGTHMSRRGILDRVQRLKVIQDIDALIGFFLSDEHDMPAGYGERTFDRLSAREIEITMNQRFCSELFTPSDAGLARYRQILGDLHRYVKEFNH